MLNISNYPALGHEVTKEYKYIQTLIGETRAHGLVVMTSPSHGEDRQFESG